MILDCLYTKRTEYKGWGVYTSRALKAGTVVEISPVIVMSATEKEYLDRTTLFNYIFYWEKDNCCMAMGMVPVYNHAYPSNCEYFQEYDKGTIYIKTVRDIAKEEELTINYNGDFDDPQKVWFDVKA